MPVLLALPSADASLKKEGEKYDSRTCGPPKTIQQAGKAYAKLQAKALRTIQRKQIADGVELKDEQGNKIVVEDSDEETKEEATKVETKKKKKTKEEYVADGMMLDNLYSAIGLEPDDLEATDMEIAKAYKDMAIMFHPDKLGRAPNEHDKEVWLQIQEAYETLTDPPRKRRYDSTLPFDDKIPAAEVVNDGNFFEQYGPCFESNGRFALVKPVPAIGDMSTPMDEVYAFYKYWDDFKTWREFCQHDEFDDNELKNAQDRYDRRYMEQKNEKGRK